MGNQSIFYSDDNALFGLNGYGRYGYTGGLTMVTLQDLLAILTRISILLNTLGLPSTSATPTASTPSSTTNQPTTSTTTTYPKSNDPKAMGQDADGSWYALGGRVRIPTGQDKYTLGDEAAKSITYLYEHSATFRQTVDDGWSQGHQPVIMKIVNGEKTYSTWGEVNSGSYAEMNAFGPRNVVIDIAEMRQLMNKSGIRNDDWGETFTYVIAHEFGHAFGNLEDGKAVGRNADGSYQWSAGSNQSYMGKVAREALKGDGRTRPYNGEFDGWDPEWMGAAPYTKVTSPANIPMA